MLLGGLWLLVVDSVTRFSHQKKCEDNYCEGYYVMASSGPTATRLGIGQRIEARPTNNFV